MKKLHYGWIICIGCFLLNFCALGMCTSTISIFYPYLRERLGVSNTEISMIPTIRCLASTLVIFVTGAYYKKVGLRLGSALSCGIMAISWLMFSRANSIGVCYLASAVMGITYSLGALYPIAIFMRNWFEDKRATAMAISLCGSSLCAIVLPPLITMVIENQGLMTAYIVVAAGSFVSAVILFFLLRETPEELGLKAYQGAKGSSGKETVRKKRDVVLSSPEKFLLIFALLLMGLVGAPSTAHYSIHFQTAGYTGLAAAAAISVYGIALAVGKGSFGVLDDRIGTYKVNYIFLVAWVVASVATALVNGSSILLLNTASFLNGIGLTNASIGVTLWCGELASEKDYERSVQSGQIANTVGSFVGTPIPGMVADLTGSYAPIYLCYAVMLSVMGIIVQWLYRKHLIKPERLEKYERLKNQPVKG